MTSYGRHEKRQVGCPRSRARTSCVGGTVAPGSAKPGSTAPFLCSPHSANMPRPSIFGPKARTPAGECRVTSGSSMSAIYRRSNIAASGRRCARQRRSARPRSRSSGCCSIPARASARSGTCSGTGSGLLTSPSPTARPDPRRSGSIGRRGKCSKPSPGARAVPMSSRRDTARRRSTSIPGGSSSGVAAPCPISGSTICATASPPAQSWTMSRWR